MAFVFQTNGFQNNAFQQTGVVAGPTTTLGPPYGHQISRQEWERIRRKWAEEERLIYEMLGFDRTAMEETLQKSGLLDLLDEIK